MVVERMDAEQLYDMIETREAWEVFIVDTVRKEKMDPWDIDLVRLAGKCLERIREMKDFDFRIPGKVVLSAAILLRMKSDALVLRDTDQIIQEYMEQYAEDMEEGVGEDFKKEFGEFPELEPMVIRTPQSKVTIDDLLGALRKVLKDKEQKSVLRKEMEVKPLRLELPEFNIGEAIKDVYHRIKKLLLGKAYVTFLGVLRKRSRQEIAQNLLPLLHLANDRRVRLEQEKMFGPIKIFKGTKFGEVPIAEEERGEERKVEYYGEEEETGEDGEGEVEEDGKTRLGEAERRELDDAEKRGLEEEAGEVLDEVLDEIGEVNGPQKAG